MAAGSVGDIGMDCLVNMFIGVLNREAIIGVVDSCGGDLNHAVDVIMTLTKEGPLLGGTEYNSTRNNENIPVTASSNVVSQNTYQTGPHNPNPTAASNCGTIQQQQPIYQLPSNSYAMAAHSQNRPSFRPQTGPAPSIQNHGAVPKVRSTSSPGREPWNNQMRRIVEHHNHGSRILILMRGAPGSGKTHLAQKVVEMLIGGNLADFKTHICSTDDYFIYNSKYKFSKSHLSEAHNWNHGRVKTAMEQGLSPIIIDNTNIELWEMEFYVKHGVENGYIIEVVEPNTSWARKAIVLAKKNKHDVPLYTIKRMLGNYIKDVTGELLIDHFKLRYPREMTPPVLRSMPVFPNAFIVSGNPVQTTRDGAVNVVNCDNAVANIERDIPSTFESSTTVSSLGRQSTGINEGSTHGRGNETQDNESENNNDQYFELQKQLEEIEKVEQEWENGESWEEGHQEHATCSDKGNENSPKPPRTASPKPQVNADENFIDVVNNCQDWSQISMFMPPWRDETVQSADPVETIIEKNTTGTCMEIGDFDCSKTSHKIISASPRNINQFHMSFEREKIPEKRMLDKSTTTNELSLTETSRRCKNEESHFCAFRKLFKNVSKTALRDIFDQCIGDVNWAVEIVLDGMATKQIDTVDEEDVEEDVDDNHELCTCLASYDIVPDSAPEPIAITEQENTNAAVTCPSIVAKKTSKRELKTSDASLQLKRQIEQNVFIAENHYSKHCLKLRKWRHGEPIGDEEMEQNQDENLPSTSQGLQASNQISVSGNETDDQLTDDEQSIASMEELERTVNINLGREFIAELDALFGRTDMSYPDSVMPKINIPISLLNEINALWMESLMYQLDEQERQAAKMLQEDEEFARVLAMKEAELAVVGKQPEVLDFKEIMDMDYALSLYQRDVAEWKNKEPNDLAAKLTREKLYNLFPDVPNEVLAELLMAHDNNFQSTVEVLLVSTGKASVLNERNGINNFVTQKEMERQKKIMEEEKKALSEVEWPLLPNGEVPDMQVVNNYRDTADRHLKSRNLNIQKASEYVRRGMLTVGGYYRQLAEFHKQKYEQSNSLAAATLMQLHAAKCPDSATIDLHYLRVGEAKESLDLFIDTHIQKLKSIQGQGARHHTLYFITGRGLHSNGKPKVKPAVKKRLRERGLNCSEVNPGLLSAKVCAEDKLTHQVA